MAISDLLTQLNNVKLAIKNALISKEVDMTNVPFTEYASKIGEISVGVDMSKVKVSVLNKGSYYWEGTSTVTVNGTVVFYVGGGSNKHNIGQATIFAMIFYAVCSTIIFAAQYFAPLLILQQKFVNK